ncbi:C40 family peptidase [Tunicatimonas pelagia]|uniref:C40 family peptidase n=1 Tax=Tunicatimonas pelagia TaxID=931531 RepID=UPI0026657137|nr:C40 family peptidase [Tunicatimonas pelagia]WKN45226.1 C40 family peptidase [Tunicatimonas pelagia]
MSKQLFFPLGFLLVCLLTGCATSKKPTTRRSVSPPPARPAAKVPSTPKRTARINKLDDQQQKIINTARSFAGTPYRWGGTTRGGMDCSGLLMISFQEAGINLPRTSAEQSKFGRLVSIRELRPGDLVFFATKSKHSRKVTHAGLVTEVRGKNNVQFIHASTKLGVVESNIFSDYYRRTFVKARRPF